MSLGDQPWETREIVQGRVFQVNVSNYLNSLEEGRPRVFLMISYQNTYYLEIQTNLLP